MTAGTGASSTRGARCSPCLRPSHAAARGCGRVGILDEDVHDVKDRLTVCCAVRISAGDLLLVRRIDDGNWELPGGRIEVGESASDTVVREVAEESGVTIELTGLAGVYSDPTHVLVDPDHTIHQQLALCFHAVPAAPTDADQPRPDHDETDAAAWFSTSDIDNLKIHPAMLLRIDHALRGESQNCTFDQ
jgi:ADP-ribose pyrophosphatase YjhB (NUDIX family)